MNRAALKLLFLFFLGCSVEQGVHFESTGLQETLNKAQQFNKPILVDVFSDG
jgi:hypothetical protein